jgi:hypothetical protein
MRGGRDAIDIVEPLFLYFEQRALRRRRVQGADN